MHIEQTPLNISYLDLYAFAGKNGWINKASIQKVNAYRKDELFALPILEDHVIAKTLWHMGMNTHKGVEEIRCFHRPNCMASSTHVEDTPKIYGLCYVGIERTDQGWKENLRKLKQQ